MRRTIEERFWEKVDQTSSCWIWTAAISSTGYGNFWINGKYYGAHRVAWELANGPIPEGKEIDHVVCANKPCVNPDHMELVDYVGRINSVRYQQNKTHCPYGHEYTETTIYIAPNGNRACRICRTRAAKESHARGH